MNTFGTWLRLTTFGESHGPAMGGVLDGFPSGLQIDFSIVSNMLAERRPGTSAFVSARKETDTPEFLSGLTTDGITLGSPIAFIFRNTDTRPKDYSVLKNIYRPNHADYTYERRYGIRDYRGGGRASARDTVNWVTAGALALSFLHTQGIDVTATLESVGGVYGDYHNLMNIVAEAAHTGDSVGGTVICTATGVPPGIGNPNFGKLHARIAEALMSINGVKGVEYGDGFEAAKSAGSAQADLFIEGNPLYLQCATNHSGGIQGGISNGMPINFRVAFKPTPTIAKALATVDSDGKQVELSAHGRHDPCIAVRGVVVARAMMALAIADSLIGSQRLFTFDNSRTPQ